MLLPVIKTDSHSTAGFYTFPKEVRGKRLRQTLIFAD